ncbi:MAG: leucyl aminopeptidase [Chlorobiaceae bacterium]|nr:leucyl aminopeptidase [Chlorobiaceae bacterium]NTW63586.1 leucyl aminopeptidase [Chlorobiaceae bacterium]
MKIVVTKNAVKKLEADILVFPFCSGELRKQAAGVLSDFDIPAHALKDFKAESGEIVLLYPASEGELASRVALLGLGDGKNYEDFRKAATALAAKVLSMNLERIAVDCSRFGTIADESKKRVGKLAEIFVEGSLSGSYKFDRLKSGKLDKKKEDKKVKGISELILRFDASVFADAQDGAAQGEITGSCQLMARDLVNLPGNYLQAEDIAKAALESGSRYGYDVKVLRKKEMEDLAMGGLLAVNQGSTQPPTFSILDYKPKGKAKVVVALVGKGVTFDSGGISLKPSEGMGEMKSDMSGAACVLASVEAAARLGLSIRVIGLIPATDNMPDGSAQKPGDVITTYSGITVEVGNTDAEGRLILADALTYAKQEYHPDIIIDLATLTGACIVALGYPVAGLFSNSDKLADEIYQAGISSGEKVWRMPLWDDYDEQIKSEVADVNNTGGRGAGAVTAAKFLEKFIDGHKKWAHVDIAGPAFLSKSGGKASGGTGFGVRLLIDLLKKWA